ncbi:hypothetical protein ACS3SW_04620 [Roseobacteraceae bacterium S113]
MAVLPSFLSRFAGPLRASPLALAALLAAPAAIAQDELLAGPVHLPANLRSLQETDAHGLTGIWTGLSDDGRPSILSFEHAGADGAVAIMLAQAGRAWDRGLGRRVGAEVRFSIGETLWTGTYRSPGRLILRSANGYERIVLSSNDLDTLLDPAWRDDFHGAEELALPAAPDTDGTPNTLKTLLYSPPAPGPSHLRSCIMARRTAAMTPALSAASGPTAAWPKS